MSLSIKSLDYKKPKICKNPLQMHEHWILYSGYKMEELGYCAVCSAQAFRDNTCHTNPESMKYHKPYRDSKINPNSGSCSNDCL